MIGFPPNPFLHHSIAFGKTKCLCGGFRWGVRMTLKKTILRAWKFKATGMASSGSFRNSGGYAIFVSG